MDTRSLKDVQTLKLDSANQLPALSPESGRVSDDPPSSEHSDWLGGGTWGCGDSASLLMSSLSSRTKGNVTWRLASSLTAMLAGTRRVASGILQLPAEHEEISLQMSLYSV